MVDRHHVASRARRISCTKCNLNGLCLLFVRLCCTECNLLGAKRAKMTIFPVHVAQNATYCTPCPFSLGYVAFCATYAGDTCSIWLTATMRRAARWVGSPAGHPPCSAATRARRGDGLRFESLYSFVSPRLERLSENDHCGVKKPPDGVL